MSIDSIISALDAKIAALEQARTVLAGGPKTPRKKRILTPEGRARIAAAVKRRWAVQKKVQA